MMRTQIYGLFVKTKTQAVTKKSNMNRNYDVYGFFFIKNSLKLLLMAFGQNEIKHCINHVT
jgi:hypothetical protein